MLRDRTDRAWFSHLVWHLARKRSGSILFYSVVIIYYYIVIIFYSVAGASDSALMLTMCALQMLVLLLLLLLQPRSPHGASFCRIPRGWMWFSVPEKNVWRLLLADFTKAES